MRLRATVLTDFQKAVYLSSNSAKTNKSPRTTDQGLGRLIAQRKTTRRHS
jgi:hypothetical protein